MNETQLIKMSRLELNHGQIPGLPGNPRQWTQADVNRLAQSLKDTPELFEARPQAGDPGRKHALLREQVQRREGGPLHPRAAALQRSRERRTLPEHGGNF